MNDRTCNRCNLPLIGSQQKFCSHACANRTNTRARASAHNQLPWATCSASGCSKQARSRTAELCKMHYHRVYRYGSLETTRTLVQRGERKPRPRVDIAGRRFGTLVVAQRVDGAWLCVCDCGKTRITQAGSLNRTGDANTCGTKANHLASHVEYGAAHGRVTSSRGPAKRHLCYDCGRSAQHWSYNHSDPNECISGAERTIGVAYSLDPNHYEARCVPCHKAFDLRHINATNFADHA